MIILNYARVTKAKNSQKVLAYVLFNGTARIAVKRLERYRMTPPSELIFPVSGIPNDLARSKYMRFRLYSR